MTQAATQDLTVTRGDTETIIATMTTNGTTPIDITGRTYAAQLRSSPDSTTIGATMTCTLTTPLSGVVTCVMSAAASALLTPGYYYWDLQETITATGVVSTVLAGLVTVLADVTRL